MTYSITLADGITLIRPTQATDPVVARRTVGLLFDEVIPNGVDIFILTPAILIAAGTLRMPTVPRPNQQLLICTTQTVTLLTQLASPGQTLLNALATISPAAGGEWVWQDDNNTWYRVA